MGQQMAGLGHPKVIKRGQKGPDIQLILIKPKDMSQPHIIDQTIGSPLPPPIDGRDGKSSLLHRLGDTPVLLRELGTPGEHNNRGARIRLRPVDDAQPHVVRGLDPDGTNIFGPF